jgi:hypothetical protein
MDMFATKAFAGATRIDRCERILFGAQSVQVVNQIIGGKACGNALRTCWLHQGALNDEKDQGQRSFLPKSRQDSCRHIEELSFSVVRRKIPKNHFATPQPTGNGVPREFGGTLANA